MARVKHGERVGVILGSKPDGSLDFLGYGTYVGDEVPPDEGGGSMTGMLHEAQCTNPKLVLDNGDVVWGCESWWGSEESVRAKVASHVAGGGTVNEVRIADARRKGTD